MADQSLRDRSNSEALARGLLQLADTAGMPDSYWSTDGRVRLAREMLGVPEDGRYSHAHLWAKDEEKDDGND